MPRRQVAGVLLLGLALLLIPLFASRYAQRYGILVLQYVGLALSWNIISGYAGYVSLGHVAFFGLGGYTGVLLLSRTGTPWPLALLAGGLVAGALSLPLGWILLRLRGPYFAIAMLAVAEGLRVIAGSWVSVTRGGTGISLPPAGNLAWVYWTMLVVAVGMLLITLWIDHHRFALQLTAIKEDEDAAEVVGVPTVRTKVIAFVISAVGPGIIGAASAWSVNYLDPTSAFLPLVTLNMIIMTMFGGAGTVWGPVVGAVALSVVFEQLWARFPELYLAVFGLAVVVVVLYAPQGILEPLRRLGLFPRRNYLAGYELEGVGSARD